MSETDPNEPQHGDGRLEAARRVKLRKIQEMGVDPWGQRFDNHTAIGKIRDRAERDRRRAGRRARQAAQAPRAEGPRGGADRAPPPGRQADLPRSARLDRTDPGGDRHETGGRKELGTDPAIRPGRPDRHRRRTEPHQDGRADDLRLRRPLPHQVHRDPAGKAQGPDRPRAAAADALPRPDPYRRPVGTLPAADEDRAVDPQHAGRAKGSSRSKARRCTPSPAARRRGPSSRTTTPWISTSSSASPWNCTSSG